ncbi:hypothetical protein HK098_001621 [Nowakowskiella sp. JEL0407]|nr:hypothetical protein HK098_001621 [Nowakowskiella sp. JEL0407]
MTSPFEPLQKHSPTLSADERRTPSPQTLPRRPREKKGHGHKRTNSSSSISFITPPNSPDTFQPIPANGDLYLLSHEERRSFDSLVLPSTSKKIYDFDDYHRVRMESVTAPPFLDRRVNSHSKLNLLQQQHSPKLEEKRVTFAELTPPNSPMFNKSQKSKLVSSTNGTTSKTPAKKGLILLEEDEDLDVELLNGIEMKQGWGTAHLKSKASQSAWDLEASFRGKILSHDPWKAKLWRCPSIIKAQNIANSPSEIQSDSDATTNAVLLAPYVPKQPETELSFGSNKTFQPYSSSQTSGSNFIDVNPSAENEYKTLNPKGARYPPIPAVVHQPTDRKTTSFFFKKRRNFIVLIVIAVIIIIVAVVLGVVFSLKSSGNTSSSASPNPSPTLKSPVGSIVRKFTGHSDTVLSITVLYGTSPSDFRLFSSSLDSTIIEYNINTSTILRSMAGHKGGVHSLDTLAGNPPYLFSGLADYTVRQWDLSTWQVVKTFTGHTKQVYGVALLPQTPPQLFSGSYDNTAKQWDVNSGTVVRNFTGHSDYIETIALLDGNPPKLYTGSDDKTIREWDTTTGTMIKNLTGHNGWVKGLSILPGNPTRLFSGSFDNTVLEWDLNTGRVVRNYTGHTGDVYAVAVLPGTPPRLFSGSADKSINEWNMTTGQVIRSYIGHTAGVRCLAFWKGDNPRLFSGSADTTVIEWSI